MKKLVHNLKHWQTNKNQIFLENSSFTIYEILYQTEDMVKLTGARNKPFV